jgi:hypothetical protein
MKRLIILIIMLSAISFSQDSLALHPQSSIQGNWTVFVDSTRFAAGSKYSYSYFAWPFVDTLTIYDIEDPAHPSILDRCFPTRFWQFQHGHGGGSTYLGGVCLWDDLIIVTHNRAEYYGDVSVNQWIGHLRIIAKEVGEPDNLWEITLVDSIFEWEEPDSGTGWNEYVLPGNLARYGNFLYVAAGSWGIRILDLSDPTSLREVDTLGLVTREIAIDGDRLMTKVSDSLVVFDISNPDRPEEIGALNTSRTGINLHDIARGHLYGSLWDSLSHKWVVIFSLQDDNSPEEVYRFDTGIVNGQDIAVSNDRLYIKHQAAIHLYDLSDPASPESLAVVLVDSAEYEDIVVTNDVLLLGCGQADFDWWQIPDAPRATIQIYNVVLNAAPFDNNCILTPSSCILYPAYPNPFNSTTTIRYSLSEAVDVRLTVYDISGRELEVLISEHQNADRYAVNFKADKLTAGLYFYKLEAGSFTSVRKMALVK